MLTESTTEPITQEQAPIAATAQTQATAPQTLTTLSKDAAPVATPAAQLVPAPVPEAQPVRPQLVPIDKLEPHPDNATLVLPLAPEEVNLLRHKLQNDYECQPLVVLHNKATGKYLVLDGNTRLRLMRELKWDRPVPVIVKGTTDDPAWTIDAQRTYIENSSLGRRNLTKEQKAEIAQRQAARGISVTQISQNLAMAERTVSEKTKDVREVIKETQIAAALELRAAGKTQAEVAATLDIDQSTVARWEHQDMQDGQTAGTQDAKEGDVGASAPVDPGDVEAKVKESLSEDAILEKAKSRKKPKKSSPQKTDAKEMAKDSPKREADTADAEIQRLRDDNASLKAEIAEKEKVIAEKNDELGRLKNEGLAEADEADDGADDSLADADDDGAEDADESVEEQEAATDDEQETTDSSKPEDVLGFHLYKKANWIAVKSIEGKPHTIYIGKDRSQAKSKIIEWHKKNGIPLSK